jgi:uncharacterized protein involved in exopolysaccharide biosynthesis
MPSPTMPPPPPERPDRPGHRLLFEVLLPGFFLSVGLCYLISEKIQPLYESVSLLRVEPSPRDLFNLNVHSGEAFAPFLETQVQLIGSPNVLSAVLSDPRIAALPTLRAADDAEVELRKILMVNAVQGTYLLQVKATSPSPTECSAIVNSVVENYLKITAEWSNGLTLAEIKSLETYQRELESQANERRESLMALAKKSDIDLTFNEMQVATGTGASLPVPTRSKATMEEYKRLRQQHKDASIELGQAEALLKLREAEAARLAGKGGDEIDRSLREAREKVVTLKVLRATLQQELSKIEVANRQEGSDAVQMSLVREQLTSVQQMQDAVKKRLEQLKYEQKGETRVTKVSDGKTPNVPVRDPRGPLMAATATTVYAALLAVWWVRTLRK